MTPDANPTLTTRDLDPARLDRCPAWSSDATQTEPLGNPLISDEAITALRKRRRRIADTDALTNPRLASDAQPLVKGGQDRDCNPAMAILIAIACIALVAFAIVVLLSYPHP